jgi:alkanesulfonate monooxygenase SsuD/methylene tetrahydromethanopterin reductase-like flavin-dependent oxidoreductase (luciferase family)
MTDPTLPAADLEASAAATTEEAGEAELGRQCTQAQLRRFIKSRAYIPMHELRRRFELNGAADELTAIRYDDHLVFIGLPEREARMIGELVRQGEVGVELSRDPDAAVAVGVFAMHPVLRS